MLEIELFQVTAGSEKPANLRKVLQLIDGTEADLAVFPEYLMGVPPEGLTADYVRSVAEPLTGEFIGSIADKLREKGISAVIHAYLLEHGRVSNAAILIEKGSVRAVYRKIHLFDAFGYKESSMFAAGSELAVTKLGGFTAGLAVCFDLRFPELFRALALRGVDLFIIPSAWYRGPSKEEQWYALTRARAHENVAFLVAVNQTGSLFTGRSVLVNPMGHALVDLGEGERSIRVAVDPSEVKEAREKVPVLNLLRRDLYREWLATP
ncbi:MAG: carbon-nitrogen hydrolase family protein [Thermofilum sp.]